MMIKAIILSFLTLLITEKQTAIANMNTESKYMFNAQDPYSSQFFTDVSSYLKEKEFYVPENENEEDTQDVETPAEDYGPEEDSSGYSAEEYNQLLDKYNQLSSDYENLSGNYSSLENDSFLNFLFQSDSKEPLSFSSSDLNGQTYYLPGNDTPLVAGARVLANNINKGSIYREPASTLNPDKYLNAIFGNEGGKTGVDPVNVKGHASGRFGLMPIARQEVFNKHFKGQMSFKDFENLYNTDANFEYQVARKLAEDKIRGSKTIAEAFASWYYPDGAKKGLWNLVPERGHGNTLTIGRYAEKAAKNYRQYGGEANTPEELYRGLNDSTLRELTLNLPRQYNLIRGLDNGQPISVEDELGKRLILQGPHHTAQMFGKVHEKKMQSGGQIPNYGSPYEIAPEQPTVFDSLSDAKKLKYDKKGNFKGLIPLEAWSDDLMNYVDKVKFIKRKNGDFIKVRGNVKKYFIDVPEVEEPQRLNTTI